MTSRLVVIGVGNRDCGDDAVGPVVCDRLAMLDRPLIETVVAEGGGVDLALSWRSDDAVTIVDASHPAGRPGRIVVIDALSADWVPRAGSSTHSIDVATPIELARVMGDLPARLTVVGVEGRDFDYGAPMSDEVGSAVDRLVEHIATLTLAGTSPT